MAKLRNGSKIETCRAKKWLLSVAQQLTCQHLVSFRGAEAEHQASSRGLYNNSTCRYKKRKRRQNYQTLRMSPECTALHVTRHMFRNKLHVGSTLNCYHNIAAGIRDAPSESGAENPPPPPPNGAAIASSKGAEKRALNGRAVVPLCQLRLEVAPCFHSFWCKHGAAAQERVPEGRKAWLLSTELGGGRVDEDATR